MKKTLLFVAAVFAFASCKKDHTCTCSYTESGVIIKQTVTYHNVSDKTAIKDCNTQPVTLIDSIGSVTVSETCTLH